MTHPPSAPSQSLFAHRPFRLYFVARTFAELARQIVTVAVGWQVYAQTDSALALGMVGLMQFLPAALLVFVGGHVADRFDRPRIIRVCQAVKGLAVGLLAWGSFAGWLNVPTIFVAVAVLGAASAFESPASRALLAGVAPTGRLQRASSMSTAAMEVAIIGGPASGGLLYALSPGVPYAVSAGFLLVGATLIGAIRLARPEMGTNVADAGTIFSGVGFVRRNPAILGTISLDLFAVLLGGATALLPIYARDILQTGPWGLGVLRSAPAVGAILMAGVLARRTFTRQVGMRMFQAVIIFGVATLVFALSRNLWLSIAALAVMGAADMVSMVIRGTLVQVMTPDHMRGRVAAVKSLFIDASNQLGEFESGTTAALLGTVPAAVLGGVGTIAVALLWMKLFPALRDLQRLE